MAKVQMLLVTENVKPKAIHALIVQLSAIGIRLRKYQRLPIVFVLG